MKPKLIWLVYSGFLALSSCANEFVAIRPDDPFYSPIIIDIPKQESENTGSLFDDVYSQNLFSDIKAHRIGDIITVILNENTNANKQAKSELAKETTVNMQSPNFLGRTLSKLSAGLIGSNEFDGEAKMQQNNSLSGEISVTVNKVLANKNLVVRGEKWITLNSGEEYVRLTGIIRPEDISSDNTVDSNKIANARMQYSGQGFVHNTQNPGWISKILNHPYWPF